MSTMTADRVRIFSYLTRTRFLHIEDSLDIRKLRIFMGSFQKGQGASSTAYTFLDLDDARVVLGDMAWGKPLDFMDYKGGKDARRALIARLLKIQSKENRVWIQVSNGPGREIEPGMIKPNGDPSAEISIPLEVFDARKMAHACLAYISAWDVAQMIGGKWVMGNGD